MPGSSQLRQHPKRKLVGTRPPRDFNHTSGAGVYRVPCKDCTKVYIGETGRDFQVRLGEHKTAVATGKEKNAVFQHLKTKNHPIDWKNAAVLYHSENERSRLVVESTLIKSQETFNNTKGVVSIDNCSSAVILSSLPHLGMQRTEASARGPGSRQD